MNRMKCSTGSLETLEAARKLKIEVDETAKSLTEGPFCRVDKGLQVFRSRGGETLFVRSINQLGLECQWCTELDLALDNEFMKKLQLPKCWR